MKSSLFATLLLPPLALSTPPNTNTKRDDTWGGSVSLGPTKSTITKAVTTLIPGAAPATQNGVLFLWPGMSNGTGDLIQSTLESWESNDWCGAASGEWCVRASVFGSFGQLDGDPGVVGGDDQVEILYELQSDQETWVHYGTGTECNEGCTGTSEEQKYINTEITLASADTTFGDTIASAGSASVGGNAGSRIHGGVEIVEVRGVTRGAVSVNVMDDVQ
ncbi:hypothetical protein BDV06DRAFT_217977 [Aspergillus oleicola]